MCTMAMTLRVSHDSLATCAMSKTCNWYDYQLCNFICHYINTVKRSLHGGVEREWGEKRGERREREGRGRGEGREEGGERAGRRKGGEREGRGREGHILPRFS